MKIIVETAEGQTQTYPFPNTEKEVLSTLLRLSGVPFEMPCGGRRSCKKCLVKVSGNVLPPQPEEQALLTAQQLKNGFRYACMTQVVGDVRLVLPAKKAESILTQGNLPAFQLFPAGKKYGVALDIGTTTLAAYLYRLQDGKLLQTASSANPQAAFGADVISRLQASKDGQTEELSLAVLRAIVMLCRQLCQKSGVEESEIDAAVFTGNTAMLYLLCKRPVHSLIAVPFAQDYFFGESVLLQELLQRRVETALNPQLSVYLPRTVSAYVGADITTAMLAVGFELPEVNGPCLLADIGTNGEMALKTEKDIFVCSTAAGPAFEGAGICCGMNASAGAISKVCLKNGKVEWQTVGNAPAVGICGSGLVDALAVLLEAGVIDETGRLQRQEHEFESCIVEEDGQPAFVFEGTSVRITQADIRAVQLAKAALAAGMLSLLHAAGLQPQAVKSLYLAGGFGNYLDVKSAAVLGLIPPQLASKAETVGNAAGVGAAMVLLSTEKRQSAEGLAARAKTLELSTDAFFMETYMEQMMFGREDDF